MVPQSLLIIHQGALGDFILTFPAIIRLHKYFKIIDVLCQNRLGKLANSLGLIDKWHPLESAAVATLFTDRVDAGIKKLLKAYTRIILFSLSAELEYTIQQFSINDLCRIPPRPPLQMHVHLTDFVLHSLAKCRLIDRKDAMIAGISLPESKTRPEYTGTILLHPGAGSLRKRWPIASFIETAARLEVDGLSPEFLLGPAEEDLAHALQRSGKTVHVLAELEDLAIRLKAAGGYIGNDSGATHLSAFLGIPTVVIFGPTDPGRWAPIGRAVETIRPVVACNPCFETKTANCEHSDCLKKTTPQMVIDAFYRVYQGASKPNRKATPADELVTTRFN